MNETTALRWRAHVAKAAANYNTMDTKVVEEVSDENDDKKDESRGRRRLCCGAYVMDGIAAAAVASSMLTWQVTSSILVKAASATTFFFGPYAAYQRRKLRSMDSLRTAQNQLRSEVNFLNTENERIYRNLVKLDSTVNQVEQIERELSKVASGRKHVSRLVDIMRQQQVIHQRIKKCLKSQIVQNILSVVVKADANRDFQLGEAELQILIVRLGMMDGVKFDEGKFRQSISSAETSGNSLSAIMGILRSLLREEDDDDDDDTVFVLQPQKLYRQ